MQSYAIPSSVMARYGNIIYMDRPVHNGDLFSRRHPAMSLLNRAKIKVELDADEEWELNRRLGILHGLTANSRLSRANAVDITVEYYSVCTDRENDAYMEKGQYLTVTGRVVRVDPHTQELKLISDGSALVIRFSDIYIIKDPADSIF